MTKTSIDLNSPDLAEVIIQHLFFCRDTWNYAKRQGLKATDFKHPVYVKLAEVALEFGPDMTSTSILLSMKDYLNSLDSEDSKNTIIEYILWADKQELSTTFVAKVIPDYIKNSRYLEIKEKSKEDPTTLIDELSKLVFDLSASKVQSDTVEVINPFEKVTHNKGVEAIMTGFPDIDAKIFGLGRGEVGLLIGHSGSGKTSAACSMCLSQARAGYKTLYICLEEPAINVTNRFYAALFSLDYKMLHRGLLPLELENAFKLMPDSERQVLMDNLRVVDLRDRTPITASSVVAYLDSYYKETGYAPDVIYLDQLDYMTCDAIVNSTWEKYEKASFEIDDTLSQHPLILKDGTEHHFATWVIHQASGKLKRRYSNQEISAFKGLNKPMDIVMALGKDTEQDTRVTFFSMKVRHAENFAFDYESELEYMRFITNEKRTGYKPTNGPTGRPVTPTAPLVKNPIKT